MPVCGGGLFAVRIRTTSLAPIALPSTHRHLSQLGSVDLQCRFVAQPIRNQNPVLLESRRKGPQSTLFRHTEVIILKVSREYATGSAAIEHWSTGPVKKTSDISNQAFRSLNAEDAKKVLLLAPGIEESPASSKSRPKESNPGLRSGIPPPRLFATGPQKIQATILDNQGVVQQVSGDLPKTELLASWGIQPRDLRKIAPDQHLSPDILVRDRAIVISLLHARAVVTFEKVFLVPPLDRSEISNVNLLLYELEAATRHPSREPFEFRVLEAVLISVVRSLQHELEDKHVRRIATILERLEVRVEANSLKGQRVVFSKLVCSSGNRPSCTSFTNSERVLSTNSTELLIVSKEFSSFGQKANSVYLTLQEVLLNDEDLAGLFLTAKQLQKPRAISDHWEAELLLETYLKQLEEIVRRYEEVRDHVKHTEDVVGIVLDSVRNDLLVFEMKLITATTGIACGSLIASAFGMNLVNSMENSNIAFLVVSALGLSTVLGGELLNNSIQNPAYLASRPDSQYRELEAKVATLGDKHQVTLQELEQCKRKISRLKRERGLLLDKIRSLSKPGELSSDSGLSSSDDDFLPTKSASPSKTVRGGKKSAAPKAVRTSRDRVTHPQPLSPVDEYGNGSASGATSSKGRRSKPARKLQTVPRDAEGNLVYPFQVGAVAVHSLGRVEFERDSYHSRAYIFPIGYRTSKRYMSIHDPQAETNWIQTIEDGGDAPRFVLTPEDKPDEIITGASCSAVWTQLIRGGTGYKIRGRDFLSNSVSGPEHFGLAIPTIKHLIQELPNARQCKYYDFQVWDAAGTLVDKKDDAVAPPPAKRPRKRKAAESHQADASGGSPAPSPSGTPAPTSPDLSITNSHADDQLSAVSLLPPPFLPSGVSENRVGIVGVSTPNRPVSGQLIAVGQQSPSLPGATRPDGSILAGLSANRGNILRPDDPTLRISSREPESFVSLQLGGHSASDDRYRGHSIKIHSSAASESGDGDRSDMDGVEILVPNGKRSEHVNSVDGASEEDEEEADELPDA
ncbi:magnesium ion transporter [Gonapodya sp. JEL0774]|nr:magnesium ion transporter [Gonapodya sp. JEL0774]